jgi:hypothetical protein
VTARLAGREPRGHVPESPHLAAVPACCTTSMPI